MNFKKLSLLSASTICTILAGCAAMNPGNNDNYQAKNTPEKMTWANSNNPNAFHNNYNPNVAEPNIDEKIALFAEKVKNQLTLLNKLKQNLPLQSPEEIVHNNDLDARTKTVIAKEEVNTPIAVATKDLPPNPVVKAVEHNFDAKLKITWENNSLDTLLQKMASEVNYEFKIVKPTNVQSRNINFLSKEEAIKDILFRIANQVDGFADVIVSHKDKIITLKYKN